MSPPESDAAAAASSQAAPTSLRFASAPRLSSFIPVKNTFLDFDDGPRALELRRHRSTPAEQVSHFDSDDDADTETTATDTAPALLEDAEGEEADASSEPPPPPPPVLQRMATFDAYEDATSWDWARGGGMPMPPVYEAEPEHAPQAPIDTAMPVTYTAPMQTAFPLQGFVLVQGFGVVPPQVSMVPLQQQIAAMIPQDITPVPVEVFTRWPVGVPPPPPPPEVPVLPDGVGSEEQPSVPPPPVPAQAVSRAPVLHRTFSVNSNLFRIRWTVDARKLKSTDREVVSPAFDLQFAVLVQFKMVIRAKVIATTRGCSSFKKAKGKGSVVLRCLAEEQLHPAINPVVMFRLSVGSGSDPSRWENVRGPVQHNFAQRATCGLPEGQDEWDFSRAVDEDTQTFVVCLEVLAGA